MGVRPACDGHLGPASVWGGDSQSQWWKDFLLVDLGQVEEVAENCWPQASRKF